MNAKCVITIWALWIWNYAVCKSHLGLRLYACSCCLENAHCQDKKKNANWTPGTHLVGHRSRDNWSHWTTGRFFTKKILSGCNRHKRKWKKRPLCSALCSIPTEFKASMKSKSVIYTVKERWAVLRSNSKIMTKQRPIPQILFGLPWSPSLDLHVGKNCWNFCWSIQRKQGDITWQASRNNLNFIGSYLQLF